MIKPSIFEKRNLCLGYGLRCLNQLFFKLSYNKSLFKKRNLFFTYTHTHESIFDFSQVTKLPSYVFSQVTKLPSYDFLPKLQGS